MSAMWQLLKTNSMFGATCGSLCRRQFFNAEEKVLFFGLWGSLSLPLRTRPHGHVSSVASGSGLWGCWNLTCTGLPLDLDFYFYQTHYLLSHCHCPKSQHSFLRGRKICTPRLNCNYDQVAFPKCFFVWKQYFLREFVKMV